MARELDLKFHPACDSSRIGVLILPGGGYEYVSGDKEGVEPAKWLVLHNINAWILTYTVADAANPAPIYPIPRREALEAVRQIRASNKVDKLGIWGFSAGGHLAAVTATDPDADLDFTILGYPVISMARGTTHEGSRHNLIGDDAGVDIEFVMSAETRVDEKTPPTFLFHTANDGTVPVQNTLGFATALAKHKVPFELLILPDGPHGVGPALDDKRLNWMGELERWLEGFGFDI
ncbi:alpha/beta-hydrolase [Hypomontagnella submonticulosa]|nr:alpha/beta-hydrolase [Hypomontagnella submonticulosa]